MSDSASIRDAHSQAQPPRKVARSGLVAALTVVLTLLFALVSPGLAYADHGTVAAPTLSGPTARTATTISVKITRTPDSGGVCNAAYGYEVLGGLFTEWQDLGGLDGAACSIAAPGYKFLGLEPSTPYTFSARAYHSSGGVRVYSSQVSLTATTLEAPTPDPTEDPDPPSSSGVAPPELLGPSARTATTISVRIVRTPDSGMVCNAAYGYEVLGGRFTDWHDVGWFPNAPCDDPDPGYRFNELTPLTTYTFYARAYHVVDGVRVYSEAATLTAMTLEDPNSPTTPADPNGVAAPALTGPTARTATTISVKIKRTPDSGGVCNAAYGYEVLGGLFTDWEDLGGLGGSACSTAAPGYKFLGLTPSTSYTFSLRAYHLVDGVKVYSAEVSLTATTLEGSTPSSDPGTPSDPNAVSPPSLTGPSARTATTISVKIKRTPDSGGVCNAAYGYEVLGGRFTDWHDLGELGGTACSNAAPGYKFTTLTPATTYTFYARAYHLVNGVKVYSPEASLSASTLAA